jgi:hypothetical protein
MGFLMDTKRKMLFGNMVRLPENVITCSTSAFSLITMNKLKAHIKHPFHTFVELCRFISDQAYIIR